MGTTTAVPIQRFFVPTPAEKLFSRPGAKKPEAATSRPSRFWPTANRAGKRGGGQALKVDEAFNGFVYRSEVRQAALSVQLREAAARVLEAQRSDEETGGVESNVQQLTFDFFSEVRSEELVRFSQRTEAVAEGLDGGRRETLIEASRKVAARFEFSVSITGKALNGFARAAEGLEEADESTFDRFLGFAEDVMAKADEAFNAILELLDGFMSPEEDFESRFNQLMDTLFGQGLFGPPNAAGDTAQDGGTTQATQFGIQLEFRFEFSAEVEVKAEVQASDPITLDLDGDGIELTSYTNGARFDILGAGRHATTAFVTGGDAFLAMDRNGNQVIDNGLELFGDQHGAANGFEELRKLDSNGDQLINAMDRDFARLLLFKDNGNGKTEPGELMTLAEAGIVELDLRYLNVDSRAAGGNRISQIASYRRADGSRGKTADAILNFIT